MSCGEISAFYTEFELFMEFYRSLCCFVPNLCEEKSVLRKPVWKKITNMRSAALLQQQGNIWMNIKNLYHWENSKVISIVVKIGNLLIIQQFDQSERSAISCNLCRSKSNTSRSPLSAGYKSEFLLLQPSLWIPKASLWPDPPPRPFTWFPLITQSLPISDPPPRRVIKGFSLTLSTLAYVSISNKNRQGAHCAPPRYLGVGLD